MLNISLGEEYWANVLGLGGQGTPSYTMQHTMQIHGYTTGSPVEVTPIRDSNGKIIGAYQSFNLQSTAEFSNYSGDVFDPRYRNALSYYNGNFNYYHYSNADFREELLRSTSITDEINDLELRFELHKKGVKDGYQRSLDWIESVRAKEYEDYQILEARKEFIEKLQMSSLKDLQDIEKLTEQAEELGLTLEAAVNELRAEKANRLGSTTGSASDQTDGSSPDMTLAEATVQALLAGQVAFNQQGTEEDRNANFKREWDSAAANGRVQIYDPRTQTLVTLTKGTDGNWHMPVSQYGAVESAANLYAKHSTDVAAGYRQNGTKIKMLVSDVANTLRDVYVNGRNRNLNVEDGIAEAHSAAAEFEQLVLNGLKDPQQRQKFLSYFSDTQGAGGGVYGDGDSRRYFMMTDLENLTRALSACGPEVSKIVRDAALKIYVDYNTGTWESAKYAASPVNMFFGGYRVMVDGRPQYVDGLYGFESLLVKLPSVAGGVAGDFIAGAIEGKANAGRLALIKGGISWVLGATERTGNGIAAVVGDGTHKTGAVQTTVMALVKSAVTLGATSSMMGVDAAGNPIPLFKDEFAKAVDDAKRVDWATEQTANALGKAIGKAGASSLLGEDAKIVGDAILQNAGTIWQTAKKNDVRKYAATAVKVAFTVAGEAASKWLEGKIYDWKADIYREISEQRANGRTWEDDSIFQSKPKGLTAGKQPTRSSALSSSARPMALSQNGEYPAPPESGDEDAFEARWTRAEIPQDIWDLIPTLAEGRAWKARLETVKIADDMHLKGVRPAERIALTLSSIVDMVELVQYVPRKNGIVTDEGMGQAKKLISEIRTLLAGLTQDLKAINAGANAPMPEDVPAGKKADPVSGALYVFLDYITQLTSLSLKQKITSQDDVLIDQLSEAMVGVRVGSRMIFNLMLYATDQVAHQVDNRLTNMYGDIEVAAPNPDGTTDILHGTIGGAVWRDQNGKFHYTGAGNGYVHILGQGAFSLNELVRIGGMDVPASEEELEKAAASEGVKWSKLSEQEKQRYRDRNAEFLEKTRKALESCIEVKEIVESAKEYWSFLRAHRTDPGARELWHQQGFQAKDNFSNVFSQAVICGIDIETEVSAMRAAITFNDDGKVVDLKLAGRSSIYAGVLSEGQEQNHHASLENGFWYTKTQVKVGQSRTVEGYEVWRLSRDTLTGAVTFIRMACDPDGNMLEVARYNREGELCNEMGDAITLSGQPVYMTIDGVAGIYDRVSGKKVAQHYFSAQELGTAAGAMRWGVEIEQSDGTKKWVLVKDGDLLNHAGGAVRYSVKGAKAIRIDASLRDTFEDLLDWDRYQSGDFAGSRSRDGVKYYGAGADHVDGKVSVDDAIDGGDGDDVVNGMSGHDKLFGQYGDDDLFGADGDDMLSGGFGDDSLKGGAGNDVVWGDSGDDALAGGDGHDSLYGGTGDDRIFGNGGFNLLDGGAGDDTLKGGSGSTILGGSGEDVIYAEALSEIDAGAGKDEVYGSLAQDSILGGEGDDILWGDIHFKVYDPTKQDREEYHSTTAPILGSSDQIRGGLGNDIMYGGGGHDLLLGQDGNDVLSGDAHDDTIDGGHGSDELWGGAGNDTLITGQQLNGDEKDRLNGGEGDDVLIVSSGRMENIGKKSSATLAGGEGRDLFIMQGDRVGLSGRVVHGINFGDVSIEDLDYGESVRLVNIRSSDVGTGFTTEAGRLTFVIMDTAGRVSKIAFRNVAQSELVLQWSGETLQILRKGGGYNGEGWELSTPWFNRRTYYGNDAAETVKGTTSSDLIYGYGGDDNLEGGGGTDILYGGNGWDVLSGAGYLYGDAGNDRLYASTGNDFLMGGDGQDDLNARDGDDTVYGGNGHDRIDGGGGADVLYGGEGNDIMNGETSGNAVEVPGGDRFYGEGGDDIINVGPSGGAAEWADGGNGNDSITGGYYTDTLLGGDGNDSLKGAKGSDLLHGGSGDDILWGGSENGDRDTLWGGAGNDTLHGEAGDDWIAGEDGNDLITGGDGADGVYAGNDQDTVWGGSGGDTLYGENGNDFVAGEGGSDFLSGGDGEDSLWGGNETADRDSLWGGNGNDKLYGENGDDFLAGEYGNDLLMGGDGQDVLCGGNEAADRDVLYGESGDDTLYGEAGDDALYGGTGDDVLNGGQGQDAVYGDAGTDTISYANSAAGVVVNLMAGAGYAGDAAGDRLKDIENVIGSRSQDVIYVGNDSAEYFDTADYLAKNLDVKAHIETNNLPLSWAYYHWYMWGRYEKRSGGWAGSSEQAVGADWGTKFDLAGYLAANKDVLDHKNANGLSDAWVYEHWLNHGRHEGRSGGLKVSGSVIDGGSGDDKIYGGVYSDYLIGGADQDLLLGSVGNDVLLGGSGHDTLYGGEGDDQIAGGVHEDRLYGDSGSDSLYGGDGYDTLNGGTGADSLWGGNHHDILNGGSESDTLDGGAGDDALYGDTGNDILWGGSEGGDRDSLWGGSGNDTLYGEGGDDYLYGGADQDVLWGGFGADVLDGQADNDWLAGESGDDYLYGSMGNDTLSGGAGNDTLWGGVGSDLFVVQVADDRDVIKDFGAGDVLRLIGVTTSGTIGGVFSNNLPRMVGGNAEIQTLDGRWITLEGIAASQLRGGVVNGSWEWRLQA